MNKMITKIKNKNDLNRSYTVKVWTSGYFALFKEASDRLFGRSNDINVLIYVDREAINESKNFPMFFALNLAKSPLFNVALSTNSDEKISENADVVVNLFNSPKNKFLKSLDSYDNGTRLFVTKDDVSNIRAKEDFKDFINLIKMYVSQVKKEIKVGGVRR